MCDRMILALRRPGIDIAVIRLILSFFGWILVIDLSIETAAIFDASPNMTRLGLLRIV